MIKLFVALSTLLIITTAFNKENNISEFYLQNQIDTIPATSVVDDTSIVFIHVDTEPGFIGDAKAWQMFLMKNLNADVPYKKGAPDGAYKIIIQFLVEKDGTTKDFMPLTKFGYGMEEECLRILKKSGKWQPAMLDGKAVRSYRKQPITFIVSQD